MPSDKIKLSTMNYIQTSILFGFECYAVEEELLPLVDGLKEGLLVPREGLQDPRVEQLRVCNQPVVRVEFRILRYEYSKCICM